MLQLKFGSVKLANQPHFRADDSRTWTTDAADQGSTHCQDSSYARFVCDARLWYKDYCENQHFPTNQK